MCCCSLVSSTPAYCRCSLMSWSQRSSARAAPGIACTKIPVETIASKQRRKVPEVDDISLLRWVSDRWQSACVDDCRVAFPVRVHASNTLRKTIRCAPEELSGSTCRILSISCRAGRASRRQARSRYKSWIVAKCGCRVDALVDGPLRGRSSAAGLSACLPAQPSGHASTARRTKTSRSRYVQGLG
jgi:hypothetical protein